MSSSYQYFDPLMDCHAATRLRHQKVGPLVGCTNQVARCIGSSRVFQLLQCGACFFGLRLRSAFSVTFWLELAKERTRKNLCPFTLDNLNLASKIRRLRRLFLNVKMSCPEYIPSSSNSFVEWSWTSI